MVAVARACTHWQLTSTPRHKDTAMNHIRRIAVMLAGLAAVSAFSALPALAAAVPPPGGDALQIRPGPVHTGLPPVADACSAKPTATGLRQSLHQDLDPAVEWRRSRAGRRGSGPCGVASRPAVLRGIVRLGLGDLQPTGRRQPRRARARADPSRPPRRARRTADAPCRPPGPAARPAPGPDRHRSLTARRAQPTTSAPATTARWPPAIGSIGKCGHHLEQ